jgi:chorismate lyase / 3-hydroxybenzoate synthase
MSSRPFIAPTPAAAGSCRIVFGAPSASVGPADDDLALHVALPVLGGPPIEPLLPAGVAAISSQGCTLFRGEDETAGFSVAPDGADLESAARDLYTRILRAVGDRRLCRIWNYVPRINAVAGGLENYRRFCRGRSLAFEDAFGSGFERELPSASAVGAKAGPLAVAFLATMAEALHFENPRQMPAFAYPPDYGPRAPSFSRATRVQGERGLKLFISGTAAIRGHETIAPNDVARQLPCTIENLQVIAETSGAGPAIGAVQGWRRAFNVYLRHAADFNMVKNHLECHMLSAGDEVTYLQADLCRADLRVEIEAVLAK